MRTIGFAFLLLALSSCSVIGTKTLYKASSEFEVRNIGITELNCDPVVHSETSEIYRNAIEEGFKNYDLGMPLQLPDYISFEGPEADQIISVCKEYGLDGLIISRLNFIHTTYSVYGASVAQNYDTEVEMKLYSNEGELLLSTSHNTYKGNSYMMPPKAEVTIYDGVEGAFKRIAKEMGLKKID